MYIYIYIYTYVIYSYNWSSVIHDTQSAQISQKQDEHNIYVIMKTICRPRCHHNGFVGTHALGHIMYELFIWHKTFFKSFEKYGFVGYYLIISINENSTFSPNFGVTWWQYAQIPLNELGLNNVNNRDGSRAAATSKMERFVIIVNIT